MSSEFEEQRREMKRFVDGEVIPREKDLDCDNAESWRLIDSLREEAKRRGLWALGHPVEIGGGGLSLERFGLLNEIIGRSEWGQWTVGSLTMQDAVMLHRYGNEEQRERWLLPMVAGEINPSVAFTEPEVAGSDPTLIRSTAEIDRDEWVVNGHKWFVTGADRAAYTAVCCRTEPDSPPHKAMTMVIVPAGTPGMELVRRVPAMGHVTGSHCEIRLSNVRVPISSTLGERGAAFRIGQDRLGPGRIFHAMRWLGQAQRAFELMVDRANIRFAHGSVLAEKGEIRRYVAESAAEIQAARLLTLDAARQMDAGVDARVQISLIKFWGARMLHNVIDRAIQVHGALGVSADTPLEKMYRDARFARLYDGPDEVHRDVVAKRLLADLDQVPWVDG